MKHGRDPSAPNRASPPLPILAPAQSTVIRLTLITSYVIYSIRINDQWRVCFRWTEGSTEDVEITDHH